MKTESLETILQRPWVWRGRGTGHSAPKLATGHALLDRALPEGWPVSAVTEVMVNTVGCGELSLLLPALRSLADSGDRIAWIAPPWLPYAPALHQQGLPLEQIYLLRPDKDEHALWAAEQLLRSGACAAVLCWPQRIDDRRFRRLQLAAEAGQSWAVVFRSTRAAGRHSPAALRIAVAARDEQMRLEILKRRGGQPPHPILLQRTAGSRQTH